MRYLYTLASMVFLSVNVLADDNAEGVTVLTPKEFLNDAYRDAQLNFADQLMKPIDESEFSVYQGFYADLDGDGQNEMVVSGEILGQELYYVMAYALKGDQWVCQILNRSYGGGINGFQIIDMNNDGHAEVFSVLQNKEHQQFCKIYQTDSRNDTVFSQLFSYETPGGFEKSCNFMMVKADECKNYRLRVDEVVYGTGEEGDIQQHTYFYSLNDKSQLVLDDRKSQN